MAGNGINVLLGGRVTRVQHLSRDSFLHSSLCRDNDLAGERVGGARVESGVKRNSVSSQASLPVRHAQLS